MANQEVTTHKQGKILKQNNRRYTDIYQGCEKGIIRTKKRFLHQKCERKAEKTQPCTERHYQSCVVIKERKTTIYRYIEKTALEKPKKLGEKSVEMGKIVAEEIQ